MHGGLRGLARSIAAKSMKQVHDAGGSVHRNVAGPAPRRRAPLGGSVAAGTARQQDLQAQMEAREEGKAMPRSGSAVYLSELLAAAAERDSSVRGGDRMRRAASTAQLNTAPSGLSLLGTSIKQYLGNLSVHGGRKLAASAAASSASTPEARSRKAVAPAAE